MARIGKKLAAVLLAVAMVVTFMPVLGTQTAYAATDTITRVDLTMTPDDLDEPFYAGDPVVQPEFTVTGVESTLGTVSTSDLVLIPDDWLGWCRSYEWDGTTDWIRYGEDGIQNLFFTAGESRMMVDIWANYDKINAVFTSDTEVYLNGQKMDFYKTYDSDTDWVGYISREAEPQPITSMEFTVTEPVKGAAIPQTAGTYTEGETSQYTYNYAWYYNNNIWAQGNWQGGITYSLYCNVTPKEGYTISGLTPEDVSINGKQPDSGYYTSSSNQYTFSLDFHVLGEYYDVVFDANGGKGSMESVSVEENNDYTLPDCSFTAPEGKEFCGWKIGEDIYDTGKWINVTGDVTAQAVWIDRVDYQVIFDNKGHGEKPSDITVAYNTLLEEPVLSEEGLEFGGWYKDESYETAWDFSTDRVKDSMTLYALWNKPITSIAITVDAPVEGANIPTQPGYYVNGETDQYTYTLAWYYNGNIWAQGSFEKGVVYNAYYIVSPKPGYSFVNLNPNNITINGETIFRNYPYYTDASGALYPNTWRFSRDFLPMEKIEVPTGKTLTYSGKSQTGVVDGTGYSVTGTKSATNAGTYEATVTPEEGYCWQDGTIDAKTVSWKINVKEITPTVTLSASSYTWNGKVKKPAVTVKDGSTKLAASDYTVTYKNNKNVGKASAVVTLKDNYSGAKTVTFKIDPKGTSLSKLTKAKKAVTVKWKKQSSKMSTSRITGYQIQLATDSKFTKNKKTVTVKGYSKVSKKVTKLKGGKKYYVRICTYKTVGGTKYYSPWSKVKTVTTKK